MSERILAALPANWDCSLGARGTWDGARNEVIGRYTLHARIASGGMASVHVGWLTGVGDFSRVVAIKRLHPQFALDAEFAARFRDEAWLSARLLHPNIVQVLDVVEWSGELLIIMEYVHGVSVRGLWTDATEAGTKLPPQVVAGILVPALHGLHAAHEATDDEGNALSIVHRDFSPQNIMVSRDGHAKVLDFGVAKAQSHLHVTSSGHLSGKAGYMSPEQVLGRTVDRRADVFAAGIVLWEMLAGERLFREPGLPDASTLFRVVHHPIARASSVNPNVPPEVDEVALRALARSPEQRFQTARELALQLEAVAGLASPSLIAQWVEQICARRLARLSLTLAGARKSAARSRLSLAVHPAAALVVESSVAAAPLSSVDPPSSDSACIALAVPKTGRRRASLAFGLVALVAAMVGLTSRGRLFESSSAVRPPDSAPSAAVPPVEAWPALTPPPAASTSTSERASASASAAVTEPASAIAGTPSSGAMKQSPGGLRFRSRSANAKASPSSAAPSGRATSVSPNVPARPDCDPPTYLDSDGIRIFKDACL